MENQTINNIHYQARRALILGTSGTGKGTLACRLISTHPAPLVLIYDWQGGEFADRLGAIPLADRDDVAAALKRGDRLICYNAEQGEDEPDGEGFDWFCEMAFEVGGREAGRKLLVADECHDLITPWDMPQGLKNILRRGRRRMMDTCLIGEMANAFGTTGRNQVNELYHFQTTDENALKYPDSLGIDIEQVKLLRKGQYIYRDNSGAEAKACQMAGFGVRALPDVS